MDKQQGRVEDVRKKKHPHSGKIDGFFFGPVFIWGRSHAGDGPLRLQERVPLPDDGPATRPSNRPRPER